jgi:glutamate decarboxylase
MLSKKIRHDTLTEHKRFLPTTYGSRYFTKPVPKLEIPDDPMPPQAAYQIISDELNLDGNPALNLASFVNTWMEPEARQLALDALNRNFIDQEEYPRTKEIHNRIINMLAGLFNAPADAHSIGTATVGSSEAVMLGLTAHKAAWKKRRQAEGKPFDKPNVIFGADAHSCFEKFALYFDVEGRVVPIRKDALILTAEEAAEILDENTIAIGAILGTTFTGQVDEIKEINDLLVQMKEENGWDIPIHVDAASGGFIAPFAYPELEWDFRLAQVKSINVSNHKFGLVYPGMGSLIFRDESDLPKELIFHINYLGGDMPNYSLNFSRGSYPVILQYYNFIRLGKSGYRDIMKSIMANAHYLKRHLLDTGWFDDLNGTQYLPVIALKLKDDSRFTVFQISEILRERGWIVPAYTLPPQADDIAVLRIVIKENFSRDMAEMLVKDIQWALERLKDDSSKFKTGYGKSRHIIC